MTSRAKTKQLVSRQKCLPGSTLTIWGDDYAAVVTVLYVDGLPADLTGYTAQSQIRNGPADKTVVLAEVVATVVRQYGDASYPERRD